VIGRSNTGAHLRTHWRSAAFHLKYAGDYFPLLLCILSASDIVLLLGLHLIYIPSLHTTTQLRRQTEIHSCKTLAHVTCEEHEGRLHIAAPKHRCAGLGLQGSIKYRPDGKQQCEQAPLFVNRAFARDKKLDSGVHVWRASTAYTLHTLTCHASQHLRRRVRHHALGHRNLLLPLPQPRSPARETHRPHLLPRGSAPDPRVPGLLREAHRRGSAGVHCAVGARADMGAHTGCGDRRAVPRAERETHTRAVGTEWD